MEEMNPLDQSLVGTVADLCQAALENKLGLDELYRVWPQHQTHPFLEQCFEDLEDCVQHVPRRLFSDEIVPEWYGSRDRWYVELDYVILLQPAMLDQMSRCRDRIRKKRSKAHGQALHDEVKRCLSEELPSA